MAKKWTREDKPTRESPSAEDAEEVVRAAARSIVKRFDSRHPDPGALPDDPDFVRASSLLADPAVPFELVARLGRESNPVLATMAHRAVVDRDDVSPHWVEWAYRRLKKVYAGELVYLLEGIERHGEPPFLARVLARADEDWAWGWLLRAVSEFVERRVEAGERPTAAEFEAVVDRSDQQFVSDTVAALEDVLPPETTREFEQMVSVRTRLEFFGSIGRVWQPPELPALTTVGGRGEAVETLQAVLRTSGPRSALLVGEHGVGKSAVAAEALRAFHEEGWFVFEAGAEEVSAGQTYIGALEGRVRDIAEHAAGKRVVWILPAFENTLWAGQHSRSPRGMLDALLPFVETRQLAIFGEIEPLAYELLVQQRPRVASLFEVILLDPLSRDETIAVGRDWRDRLGADVDDTTIGDAHDLAQNYLAGVAAPGRLLRLLKTALSDTLQQGHGEVRGEQVIETLSCATGLPLHVVDPNAPLDLEAVREFFSIRVLGQQEAVDCLVDRIALIKANLTDPTRPLGVFLFVGPTGTGKTEIAKALAEFLFGSEERLVRLDMSEFQTERSFDRLLADSSTASDGEAAALISSVRSKPFSVVLLDEFEKAHRSIWSLFLQLFDDGRLTDQRGRTADFRHCVVILTSNLGAAIRTTRPLGFTDDGERFRPEAVERELARVFKAEFLNRIDRIVVFRPFEREQIRALLERELAQVLDRRGFRMRPWAVEFDESALEFLAEKGFSAELGARPLKRAVERYLLAPLAAAIVSRSFPEGDQFLFVSARDDRIEVTFVDPDADEPENEPVAARPTDRRLQQIVLAGPRGDAAEAAFLRTETARIRQLVDGDGWSGCKERDLAAMRSEAFWDSPERFVVLARVEYVDRLQAALRTAEKLSARLERLSSNGKGSTRDIVTLLAERLYLLDRASDGLDATAPANAYLEVRAAAADEEWEFGLRLRDMYEAWARRRGMRVRRLWSEGSHVLSAAGIGSYAILAAESGLHVFESPQDERSFGRLAVQVAVAPAEASAPDTEPLAAARAALDTLQPSSSIVRRYRTKPSPLVRDSVRDWRTGRLDRVLAGEFDVMLDAG